MQVRHLPGGPATGASGPEAWLIEEAEAGAAAPPEEAGAIEEEGAVFVVAVMGEDEA